MSASVNKSTHTRSEKLLYLSLSFAGFTGFGSFSLTQVGHL